EFVERHPIGSPVEATIESYSSHGAYATVGTVRCYLPLRYLANPAPRSARDVVGLGDRLQLVVVSFNPSRRGIDVAVPELAPAPVAAAAKRTRARKQPVAEEPAAPLKALKGRVKRVRTVA